MKETKIYTYDDWWNGKVTLVHATRLVLKGDKPILVDWANFSEEDVEKIKSMQQELFAGAVAALLSAHKTQFLSRYQTSEMKEAYHKAEFQQCSSILFEPPPNQKTVFLKRWGIGLEHQFLTDIQYYVDRTIKNGIDDGLGFVHSPKNRFQTTGMPDSRIYARFVWQYYNWLKSTGKKEILSVTRLAPKPKIRIPEDHQLNDALHAKKSWFQVGLLFATGQIDELIEKHKNGTTTNCAAIARSLGKPYWRTYISESMFNAGKSSKNIFANPDKVRYLIDFCKRNNHPLADSFMKRAYKKKALGYSRSAK